MNGLRSLLVGSLVLTMAACATTPPAADAPHAAAPADNGPFLSFSHTETVRYGALAKEQEALLAGCAKTRSCDRVHFTLGLIALAQSRETAAWHFATVVSAAQKTPLTVSSELWLKVLQTPLRTDEPSTPLMQRLAGALVREYLDRELGVQDLLREQRAASAQTLQELTAKDQRIKSLSDQLEALKRIDEDIREKTRPLATRPVPAPPLP